MLATELMIPNRFQYSIDGWRRLGLNDQDMVYLIEHTSVDAVHAEDWLNQVILPVLAKNPDVMTDILYGVFRRLNVSVAVLIVFITIYKIWKYPQREGLSNAIL